MVWDAAWNPELVNHPTERLQVCFLLVFGCLQPDISDLIKTAHKNRRKEERDIVADWGASG